MRGVAALVILGLKVAAGSPIELSLVGQDITGGQLWPSEGESRHSAPTRQLSTLSDQKEVQQARSEEAHAGWAEHSARFWMGSLPHTVRRTAASDGEAAASGHVRSGREVFQDVWWGTRGVPGTLAPVMLVAVMLSVAALALLIASTVHVREPDQEQVEAEKPLSPRARATRPQELEDQVTLALTLAQSLALTRAQSLALTLSLTLTLTLSLTLTRPRSRPTRSRCPTSRDPASIPTSIPTPVLHLSYTYPTPSRGPG